MTKTKHDADCAIYSALINRRPEDGICTCRYALEVRRNRGSLNEMYSEELQEKLRKEQINRLKASLKK